MKMKSIANNLMLKRMSQTMSFQWKLEIEIVACKKKNAQKFFLMASIGKRKWEYDEIKLSSNNKT